VKQGRGLGCWEGKGCWAGAGSFPGARGGSPGNLHPWGLSRGRGTQGLIKGILQQCLYNNREMDSVAQEAPSPVSVIAKGTK